MLQWQNTFRLKFLAPKVAYPDMIHVYPSHHHPEIHLVGSVRPVSCTTQAHAGPPLHVPPAGTHRSAAGGSL